MFRSYIASIIGFLLGVGTLLYAGLFTEDVDPDNVKQEYSFNSASIHQKLIGKTLEEITEQYLPPTSVKAQKGKGNMVAHYEGIKIFTRGEKTLVYDMDITFKQGWANSISYGKPTVNWDAKIANASPLAFFLMDKEVFTKHYDVVTPKTAEKWQIPLLLLLLVILVNFPFLLTWPLATLMAKKMNDSVAFFLIAILWGVLYWVYLGIAAYAFGTALMFLILGGIWYLYALRKFYRTVHPVTYSSSSSYDSSYDSGSGSTYVGQDVRSHIGNLWILVQLCSFADIDPKKRMDFLADIATRERVSTPDFKEIINNATLSEPKHVSNSRKEEFLDDLAGVLVCDTTFSDAQSGYAFTVAEAYGEKREKFIGRMITYARTELGKQFPEDYTVVESKDLK